MSTSMHWTVAGEELVAIYVALPLGEARDCFVAALRDEARTGLFCSLYRRLPAREQAVIFSRVRQRAFPERAIVLDDADDEAAQ